MRSIALIPALNEEATVAGMVANALPDVDEVVVVDSCSDDGTARAAAAAGARVVRAPLPGKHHAIRTGIDVSQSEEIVFLDGDLAHPASRMAGRLLDALRSTPDVAIAKAYYERPFGDRPVGGGRLTELCARPLIALLLPELGAVRQPLAGEYAVLRKTLVGLKLSPGFAVDLGILIHCSRIGRVAQVDLGVKRHKHRELEELGDAAVQVAATLMRSAGIPFTDAVLQHFVGELCYRSEIDLRELDCPARCENTAGRLAEGGRPAR